jgi:ABC-type phosphate transport system auxiliary subunit
MTILSWFDYSGSAWTWRHYAAISALALLVSAGLVLAARRRGMTGRRDNADPGRRRD